MKDAEGNEIVESDNEFAVVEGDVTDILGLDEKRGEEIKAEIEAKRGKKKKAPVTETPEAKLIREAAEKKVADDKIEADRLAAELAKRETPVLGLDGKPVKDEDENELSEEEKLIEANIKSFTDYKDDDEISAETPEQKLAREKLEKDKPVVVEDTEEIKSVKTKATKYDELINDPYVKSIFAFKESGKDISELPEFLGIKAVPKLSSFKTLTDADRDIMTELIRTEVEKSGLPTDDHADAIEEKMVKFEGMDMLERKAYYDLKVGEIKKAQVEKLKDFEVKPKLEARAYNFAEPEKYLEIEKEADKNINTFLTKKIGETEGFLIISKTMIDKIFPVINQLVAREGAKKDAAGKIIGYEITDKIFSEAVNSKYAKHGTKLALEAQEKHLKKKWLMENNIPNGGQHQGKNFTNNGNKTLSQVIAENKGKIEYV